MIRFRRQSYRINVCEVPEISLVGSIFDDLKIFYQIVEACGQFQDDLVWVPEETSLIHDPWVPTAELLNRIELATAYDHEAFWALPLKQLPPSRTPENLEKRAIFEVNNYGPWEVISHDLQHLTRLAEVLRVRPPEPTH